MFEKISSAIQTAQDKVKQTATDIGDAAREKVMSVINGWVEILPRIEEMGLEITSFGLSMGLNPCLQIELEGPTTVFTIPKIQEILDENAGNSTVKWIFQAVKTTVTLHDRANAGSPCDPILVKIQVKLSPEITVFIGRPQAV